MPSLSSLLAAGVSGWRRLIRRLSIPSCSVSVVYLQLPYRHPHLAALEQGAWLEELELLQLAQALQANARQHGGYDAESFDVMLTIAEVLEADHGWTPQQSEAWLERLSGWGPEL